MEPVDDVNNNNNGDTDNNENENNNNMNGGASFGDEEFDSENQEDGNTQILVLVRESDIIVTLNSKSRRWKSN